MKRSRLFVAALAVGALAASTQVAPSVGARAEHTASGHTASQPKAGTNGWKELSNHTQTIISQPDILALPSGGIQAVWEQDDNANKRSIRTRIVNESGSIGSPVSTVVSGWETMLADPQIISHNGDRLVVFAGLHSTTTSDPLNVGSFYYATSGNGTSWSIGPGSLSQTRSAGSYGTGAIDDGGTPVVGTLASSTEFVTLHRGIDSARPAASPDWTTPKGNGAFSYNVSLAQDANSGDVWAAWYSNSSKKKFTGFMAEKVYPTPVGTQYQAPASVTKQGNSSAPVQDVALAARSNGGVYLAYFVGYPFVTKIGVWKVGTNQKILVPAKYASDVTLATGPHGRLWLAWYDNSKDKVHVTRSNEAATKFGTITTLAPPSNRAGSSVWNIKGSGETGPLHLVVNANLGSGHPGIWYKKVLPGLTLVASPRTLDKGTVTAKVTDAGAPVAGAKVTFGNMSKTTNGQGVVKFSVSKGFDSGKVKLHASKSGYAAGTATVKVT